jgi:membrane protease YdiL (CAAX protease family)
VARWRVRPRWYVVGLGLPAAVVAALALAHVALGTPLGEPPLVGQGPTVELPLVYAVHLVSLSVIGGGQEELGWRGFALPRLLDRVDATTASLVVGTVWAVWHLPLFAMGDTVQSGTAFVPYLVTTLGISVVLTWLYRGARRSVLLAVLFHGSLNASGLLSPVGEASGGLQWLEPVVWSLLAIALVVVHGRRLQSGEAVDGDRGERR